MKTSALILNFSIILLAACNSTKEDIPELFLKTSTTSSDGNNRQDTITVVDSDYFEIGLYSMKDGEIFSATRETEKEVSGEITIFRYVELVGEDGIELRFKNSNEFLNFMSERGYEMVDQIKEKYRTDYTFRKK